MTLPSALLDALVRAGQTRRRRVFLSYHHSGDQAFYDFFSATFHDQFEAVYDNSVDLLIGSDCSEYIMRRIREDFISGTSCTFVLCGAETPWRKFIDWEIKATLDKEHGLLGVNLPTNPLCMSGKYTVPDRLHDNVVSGYASWMTWDALLAVGPQGLADLIEAANSRPRALIVNDRPMMARNGVPPWQR